MNAWPLDEGLIDYVDAPSYGSENDENLLYTANVIASTSLRIDGNLIDTSNITTGLIQNQLQEVAGIEANVASGYHAIGFLLWGQDLNGNNPGSGNRPYTDFSQQNCTNSNCQRRGEYLLAASQLLVSDLEEMVANWEMGGTARAEIMQASDKEALSTILTGMGSLSYGELAGERMKLGLLLGDPEEEHDCFSDNTHNSHYYDALGIQNIYLGTYRRINGEVIRGSSLSDLIASKNSALDHEMKSDLKSTMQAMMTMVERAEAGEAYDQMMRIGNTEGNLVVQDAIDALVQQTKSIERVIASLDLGAIEIEGSDSLDNPGAVFQ